MMYRFITVFLLFSVWSISNAYSCVAIDNYCDYIQADDAVFIAQVSDKAGEESKIQVTSVLQGSLPKDNYSFFGDQRTSCNASIDALKNNQFYVFVTSDFSTMFDTIYYYQCMAPIIPIGDYDSVVSSCDNLSLTLDMTLFHNPVQSNQVIIENREIGDFSYELISTNGRLIIKGDIASDASSQRIHLSIPHHLSGVYVLRISDGRKYFTEKLYIYN